MEPNFHDSEYLLTDKVTYRFGDPERGDVIVFKAPPTHTDEFIKRIIGLPGDSVKVEDGKVFVNDVELLEPYLMDGQRTLPGKFLPDGVSKTVPANSYFVMGDNRDHSLDSRNLGFIDRQYITGKAWFVYWPPSSVGNVPHPTYAY